MEWLLVAVLVIAIVWVVSAPLRRGAGADGTDEEQPSAERAELEAAKESKYREIRDAEMDYRTGKLSEADWKALDRALRGEAIELLRRIDRLP